MLADESRSCAWIGPGLAPTDSAGIACDAQKQGAAPIEHLPRVADGLGELGGELESFDAGDLWRRR